MSDVQEILPHTAISTWSGFVYQGKIALLHCLNLIHKYNTSVSNYKLKLENIDDFAIHNNYDTCLSMHQVKAYKSTNFSTYKEAIKKQYDESKKYKDVKSYFHISKQIKDIPKNFPSLYPSVKIYEYKINNQTKNNCPLDEVDILLEKTIENIYIQYYNDSPYKHEPRYLEISRNVLENIILHKVIAVHHKIQITLNKSDRKIASEECINFDVFFDLLNRDLAKDICNETYFLDILRKDIGIIYNEFCDEIDPYDDIGDFVKLGGYISEINKLDSNGMTKFIRSILPDRKGTFSTLEDYSMETFNKDDLKQGLFYILDKLKDANKSCLNSNPNLFYWTKSKNIYYPTALICGVLSQRKTCRKIIQNSIDNDVDFLYESGTLVTAYMTNDNIFNDYRCGPNTHLNKLSHKRINQFKSVSLVSMSDIPQDLLHEKDN